MKKGKLTIGIRDPNGVRSSAPSESPVVIQLASGGQTIVRFAVPGTEFEVLGKSYPSLVTDLRAWRKPPKT